MLISLNRDLSDLVNYWRAKVITQSLMQERNNAQNEIKWPYIMPLFYNIFNKAMLSLSGAPN